MAICYLGIGSNLGDRRKNIRSALQKIDGLKDARVIKTSKIIETSPVGGPCGEGEYLNAVTKIKTNLKPRSLLKELKNIECQLGRPKKHARFGPRTIDLDILFYADKIIDSKELKIPHPRIFEREFVVKPLLEIL